VKYHQVMPPHIAASVGSLDDKSYASDQHVPTTHEHYVKVVKHEVCGYVSVHICVYISKKFVCV